MTAEEWLRERVADAPPALFSAMLAAVARGRSASVPERLAEGALTLYEDVVSGAGDRAGALPLLAADALFTHAFQAMAEIDPAAAKTFAEEWVASEGLARLAS